MRLWKAFVAFLAVSPRVAHSAPEDLGPETVSTWDAGAVEVGGAKIPTRVLYPAASTSPRPVVVLMHGNFRRGQFHAVLAETLSSRGFVVLLPDMPCGLGGCDHDANAEELAMLLSWAKDQGATPGSVLFGRVSERRALVGHSYGALAAFLASARTPGIDAAVLLDPKDDQGVARSEAPSVTVPSLHMTAERVGVCNGGWDTEIFPRIRPPHMLVRVLGAAHCDVEEPSNSLCSSLCGEGDPSRSAIFRRYTSAFLACILNAEAEAADLIGGPALDTDKAAGVVDSVSFSGEASFACRSDAPLVSADGGTGSGPIDGAVGGSDRGGDRSGTGGCGCTAMERSGGARLAPISLASLTLALLTGRRLRRRFRSEGV